MYEFIKTSHSYLAWSLLSILLVAILVITISRFSKKPFSAPHLKVALVGMIATHIQLLLGLILYVISPYGIKNLSGATMKDSFARLLALEHPITMILAIVLITVGYAKAKKAVGTDRAYSAVTIYYTIALILMLSRIPWQVWMKG
ncbi:MAG TPA: cytochrome B [Saprospiraceae bacterium]|nr:cytochrome B [Saprospiraceae bacterium]